MRICSSCGRHFEASSDSEALCPQCASEPRSQLQAHSQPGLLRRWLHSPTIVLIALNTLVYLLMVLQGRNPFSFTSQLLLRWGANSGALTSGGEWWRLVTCTFVHGGLLHIALNMWCLYALGWLAELLFGRFNYVLLYFMCGIGGSLASICWRGNGLSVGASGAIFGIAGALIPAMILHGNPRLRHALKSQVGAVGLFVVFNLAFGASIRGIDNAAHVGGLLTGLALGVAFPTGMERRQGRGMLRVAGSTLVVLVLFTAAGAVARQRNAGYIEANAVPDAIDRGDIQGAILHAQRAAKAVPNDPHVQFMLGTLLLNQKRYDEAIDPLRATIELHSDFGPAYVNLCAAQLEMKQLTKALQNCEKGAKLAPGDAVSWFDLGRARYALHDLPGARDAMAKAVSLNPQGFDENFHYGLFLLATGETGKAIPYLRKAHNLHPEDAELNQMLNNLLAGRTTPEAGKPQRGVEEP
jgi:rhomboid protease GluP